MKFCGIVCEYNPFHNGHKYQIESIRKSTDADIIVCVMSGNFVQRGEPAIFDKFTRTKMALSSGADIVIELPTIYATSSAEYFSTGAVSLLNNLNCIDYLSFGIETDNYSLLERIADLLSCEPESYKEKLKSELRKGLSFPVARSNAIKNELKKEINEQSIEELLKEPNNTLSIEYLKSIKKLNSSIIPVPIKRIGPGYNSKEIINEYASATAIRSLLHDNKIKEIKNIVTSETYNLIKENIQNGKYPMSLSNFEKELLFKLRTMTKEEIMLLPDVKEGLDNLILSSLNTNHTLQEILEYIKSKRYTLTRVQRLLIHAILGTKSSLIEKNKETPKYARILGVSKKGKKALSIVSKKSSIPLVTSVSNFMKKASPEQKEMLEQDVLATNIYNLGYEIPNHRLMNEDYTYPLITL